MNKIICEICGTVYPDNATMCPICGYPRPDSGASAKASTEAAAAAHTTERVRGGRFSNSNVKKRNQGAETEPSEAGRSGKRESGSHGDDRGLKITALILLAAVLLVGIYIGLRFFGGADAYDKATTPSVPTTATDPTETEPEDTAVACTDIEIVGISYTDGVEFQGKGRAWRMNVALVPANTTDELTITSSDESVVEVSISDDRIELISVGPGKATVTVSAGAVSKEFPVLCSFEGESTEPTDESAEPTNESTEPTDATEPTLSGGKLELNRTDFSMFVAGDSWQLYSGTIPKNQISWRSSNEKVATVENGLVTAVGPGYAVITATYNGQEVKCDVHCQFTAAANNDDEEDPTEAPAEAPTEATKPADTSWAISNTDVTISVGESFSLTVTNSSGEVASVSWSANQSGVVSISGSTVTGVTAGKQAVVTGTYAGKSFTCIVRVK